ncbi:MAG: hypothetical protein LUJ25_02060, partial [Firmicutes bacterium]|nr:hypothetical protein [Bacillota bacterium]
MKETSTASGGKGDETFDDKAQLWHQSLLQREFSKKFAVQRSICYNNIEQQGIASLFKLDEYCA